MKPLSVKILTVLTLSAWALSAGAAPEPSVVEIEIFQQLGQNKNYELQNIINAFNKANPKINVQITERSWLQGEVPEMMILSAEDENKLQAANRFKPLWRVMQENKMALKSQGLAPMVSPVSVDSSKRLVALPIALSTPVTYYNKTILDKAGVDTNNLPKTWLGWQSALDKISNQTDCPFTMTDTVQTLLENNSAWSNQAYSVKRGRTEELAVNGLVQVKQVAMMNTWIKADYLRLFSSNEDTLAQFMKGQCAVMVSASSDYPYLLKNNKFELGVTALPYQEDAYGAPQNTLADGPNLWVGSGKSAAKYKAVAQFLSFWLTPATQVQWQVEAGYLPLNSAGAFAASNSALLSEQMAAQKIAITQLTSKSVNANSTATAYAHRTGLRQALDEALKQVWSNQKPAKLALDDAVEEANKSVAASKPEAKSRPKKKK